jgi:hypothetical protein
LLSSSKWRTGPADGKQLDKALRERSEERKGSPCRKLRRFHNPKGTVLEIANHAGKAEACCGACPGGVTAPVMRRSREIRQQPGAKKLMFKSKHEIKDLLAARQAEG